MNTKDLILQWVKLFNERNAIEIANLYHDDAINHQVTQDKIIGKKKIYDMFNHEFGIAIMECIIENIFEDGDWCILEWRDPQGLRGCGFFKIIGGKIKFQRGYWDKLSFLRMHNLPIPKE